MGKAFEIEYKHKKVEIHIIDFEGDVRNINGTPDLFSLSYNSNINDKGQYILTTEAEINIYEDDYFNIDELKTVGETDILIKYFEGADLVWQGFALPDFFQTGITKPRALRIVATDRLGVLKNIANTSVSNTPKEIIEECLLQTGLTLPIEIRDSNTYLETTTINRERIEGVSAYDVIRTFMVQFNSKIVQYKNKWWIVNKKLLEDGFSDQEVIDIDLVYLDGQREIKPTASDVSLFLEFGGSKKYPKNWNFEKLDEIESKFDNWTNYNGFEQGYRRHEILFYNYIDGYYNAVFSFLGVEGPKTEKASLWYRRYWYSNKISDNIFEYSNLRSDFVTIPTQDSRVEISLSGSFTTRDGNPVSVVPVIRNITKNKYFVYNADGEVIEAGNGSLFLDVSNFDEYVHNPRSSTEDGFNFDDLTHEVVDVNWDVRKTFDVSSFGSYNDKLEIQVVFIGGVYLPESLDLGIDIFINSVQISFNDSQDFGKGLIFKTKQGGDKFSKVRETETTLFSDKINQGVNGYFYNYKYDDTSITNLPKEYLLQMTRQMADMFSSARDFYSFSGKFKVNPLARYRCGSKYFVLVGGQSKRKTASIEIEEIVSNEGLIRTDYIYTYFDDSKEQVKSIGKASGSSGGSSSSGGGGMTSSQLEMLTNLADWWKLDEENDAIYSEKSVYSLKGVSALGLGSSGGGGGDGGGIDKLDSWANYTEAKADFYAPASLLVPFRNDTLSRLTSLEAGGGPIDIEIAITGSGNAVTGVSLSGNLLTFSKGSTFSLSTHNHDTLYKPIGYVPSWGEITDKPTTFAPSAHTHTIANITDLQSALNSKQSTLIAGTNITISGNTISASGGMSSVAWGDITGKPTTFVPSAHTHTFASLTNKPTTLAGYEITDGVTLNTAQTITGAKTFSTLLTASAGTNTPKVDFGNGFTIEPSGTELVFKYNDVIKQRMLSDGTILAVGGITALATD